MHKATLFGLSVLCCIASACTLSVASPTPTPLPLPTATLLPPSPVPPTPTPPAITSPTPSVFVTLPPGATQVAATQMPPASFCADTQATTLIANFKAAVQGSDGTLLASLVSPTHGTDVRLYRDGRVVNYDQQHAKFLFVSTFSVDWGAAPGSGQETNGAFHDVVLPDLLDVFNRDYTLTCNQVQVGGASYPTTWAYPGINFYSVYYPGTSANGNMDWHTWLLGMHYVNGRPYLYALMQFKWEP